MVHYVEGGLYTNHAGIPAIYCGQLKDSNGDIIPSFLQIADCPPLTRNEEIVKYIRIHGIDNVIKVIILAPVDYTGYDHGYLGKIPEKMYDIMKKKVVEWTTKPIQP